jgi:peptidyl-prolyl cis-trans isomerase SurA
MKKAFWTVLMILCSFCNAEARIVDRIYAQVNEDIITLSDINRKMEALRIEFEQRLVGEDLEEAIQDAEKTVLDSLIQEKLLVQKAIELGIDADVGPQVASEIQGILKSNNFKSMEELGNALENQGTTLDDFREMIKNQIMASQVIDIFVGSRITLMKSEVEKYYKDHAVDFANPEEVSLSEITITTAAEGSEEAAENRARDLYNRLKQGESFTELAGRYSKGATADEGGNIGSNLLEKWHPDIVKAISGVESGDISEPQKIKEGYVIYRVDSRKPSAVPLLEEVETKIKERLYMDKYEPELERYVSRLKEEAYIQIYPEKE